MDVTEVEACTQHGSASDGSLPTITAYSVSPPHMVVPFILLALLPTKFFILPSLGRKNEGSCFTR